jgi:Bacterial Ig domain
MILVKDKKRELKIMKKNLREKSITILREKIPLLPKLAFLLGLILLSNIFLFGIARAGVIDTLQPGEWSEIPDSKIRSVVPSGLWNPVSIIDAWNSGTYDTKRDRYLVMGGGHNNYGGNELYAFDINTLKWSRIWGPSTVVPAQGGSCNETYPDGNPSSRHTYDAVEYIPGLDRLWIHGGSLWCGSGGSSQATWLYNFVTAQWERKSNPPIQSELMIVSGFDPQSQHIFMAGHFTRERLQEYDPMSDKWFIRGDQSIEGEQTATIDTKRRLFVSIGNGKVFIYNLNTSGQITRETILTTGDIAIINKSFPGVAYDPVHDKIVAWQGDAGDPFVYALDMDTRIWTKYGPTTSVNPSAASETGTFGRWQYIPSKNVFIIVNSIDENVWVYRPNFSTPPGPVPPDTTPPFVSITNPVDGSTVSGAITLSASASDNVGVVGVQFKLDGQNLGIEDLSSPFSYAWDTTQVSNGFYVLSASARDAAGNNSLSVTTTVEVSNEGTSLSLPLPPPTSTGIINIPSNTWIARPAPEVDKGPCPLGDCKDMRLAYNPDNRRIYFLGGDYGYSGAVGRSSGRNELYSYSILNGDWQLETPYCLTNGDPQPNGPDEVGWVYDTGRHIFWMKPGYQWDNSNLCPQSNLIKGKLMTFDPITRKWDVPPRQIIYAGEINDFIQYDPISDTLIGFVFDGGAGASSIVYDIATDTWETTVHGGNERFGSAYSALDVEGRVIYLIDSDQDKLYRYNIETKELTFLTNTPADAQYHYTVFYWDSVNKVILWPYILDNGGTVLSLYIYHPDTNTWEAETPFQPDGFQVRGNNGVFDPQQNALLIMGARETLEPYFYLYRYGNGTGGTPDTVPPSPPKNLKLKVF